MMRRSKRLPTGVVGAILWTEGVTALPQVTAPHRRLTQLARDRGLSEVDVSQVKVGQEANVTVGCPARAKSYRKVVRIAPFRRRLARRQSLYVLLDLDVDPIRTASWG